MNRNNVHTVSHISSMKELKNEILILKLKLRSREIDLEERAKKIPQEALKVGTAAIIPAFIKRAAPPGVGSIFQIVRNILSNKTKSQDSTVKSQVISGVKKVGAIAAIKGIYSFIKKRKKKRAQEKLLKKV